MPWYSEFNSTFWISAGTLLGGILALVGKNLYRSKCHRVNLCWGMFQIIRDTRDEIVLDLEENRRHQPDSEATDPIPSPTSN
jgi:hypothetical protein